MAHFTAGSVRSAPAAMAAVPACAVAMTTASVAKAASPSSSWWMTSATSKIASGYEQIADPGDDWTSTPSRLDGNASSTVARQRHGTA